MSIGAYEPFWINNQERHLYAALHRSTTADAARIGVLLVPPLVHEQHRSHRFLCEIASCLSELGLTCLRFSYFGTSDSEGTGEQLDLLSMASDIERAGQALRDCSQCERFIVIAFSSGAVPLRCWLAEGGVPSAAVLWDPVLDGAAWLRDLEQADARERRAIGAGSGVGDARADDDGQLMGYPVSEKLRGEFAGAGWMDPARMQGVPVWSVLPAGQRPAWHFGKRSFALPADTPGFGHKLGMEEGPTLSASVERIVQQLGLAVLAEC